jgi:hypothetical protein
VSDPAEAPAYLATRYEDRRRRLVIERRYLESGDVVIVRDGEPELRCRFTPDQVAAAKAAVRASGVAGLADVPRGDHHDTATMRYRWRLGGDGGDGELVDRAYPAVVPDELDRLEAVLDELEAAARGIAPGP